MIADRLAALRTAVRVALLSALAVLALSLVAQPALVLAQETTADAGATESAASTSGSTIASRAVPAARQADRVAIITIHGEIDRWTVLSVERRMKIAVAQGANAICFEIDSPGGEVGAVIEICKLIKNSSIPNTVAWINPDAYSGGAIIALACREIVVAEYATMGDALPIAIGPMGLQQLPDAERQKILAPLLTEVVDSARRRGYDEKLVQALVTLGVELWMVENTQTGEILFIDEYEYSLLFDEEPIRTRPRVASGETSGPRDVESSDAARNAARSGGSEEQPDGDTSFIPASPELGEMVTGEVSNNLDVPSTRPTISGEDQGEYRLIEYVTDGKAPLTLKSGDLIRYGFAVEQVRNRAELEQFFGSSEMGTLTRSWSESLARFLASLPVKGLLIVVFLISLFLEMASPGLGFPGAVALVALLGLFAPSVMVGAAAWWALAAVGGGIVLLVVEVLVIPGFGVFGVGGLLLLLAGLVGVVVPEGDLFPDSRGETGDLLWGLATVLAAMFTAGVGIFYLTKRIGSLPLLNRLVLTDVGGRTEQSAGMLSAMGAQPAAAVANIGDVGRTITPLRPAGSAEFEDRVIDVVSGFGFVDADAPVRVTTVDAFRVVVEPIEQDLEERGDSG